MVRCKLAQIRNVALPRLGFSLACALPPTFLAAFFSILSVLLLVALLAGCGTARRGEPVAEPLAPDSAQLARGERVFMTHCNKCHPGGAAGLGFALNNKPLPGTLIKTQVRAGMGAMPRFSRDLLTEADLDDLVAYMKYVRKSDR